MNTGVSCSSVMALLAVVSTKATMKEMFATKAKRPMAMALRPKAWQRGHSWLPQQKGTEMKVAASSCR